LKDICILFGHIVVFDIGSHVVWVSDVIVVDIFEIGTGKLTFSIPQNFVVSDIAWSPEGKYISVACGNN